MPNSLKNNNESLTFTIGKLNSTILINRGDSSWKVCVSVGKSDGIFWQERITHRWVSDWNRNANKQANYI